MARRSISGMVVADVTGWILIASDDDEWHVAWLDVFGTKKEALGFAKENGWPMPFKAIRGRIIADPTRS